jgi:uncharacterized protein (DUF1330 family)
MVITCPVLERAREWYASPVYAKALELRGAALARRLLFVDGLVPG